MGRRLRVILVACSLGLVTLGPGCSGGQTEGARLEQAPSALLTVDAAPGDPRVFVDSVFWGQVSDWPQETLQVPAGDVRLELQHEGYYPHRLDLHLEEGRAYTLKVHMVRHLK